MRGAKLLVIGIDGLRWDRVDRAVAPRLTALSDSGVFAPSLLPREYGAETVSGPGWSTIATGVWPAKHGVRDNEFEGKRYDRYPDFLTRIAREGLSTIAVLDWPPMAHEGMFSAELEQLVIGDGEALGYLVEDRRVTDEAVRLLRHGQPDAAFVYLGSVDMVGHGWGAMSAEYVDMISVVDGCVGQLLDAIEHRPSRGSEHWLIMVTTDHGHLDEGGHGGVSDDERRTFVLYGGDHVEPGERDDAQIVDVAATALAHLGLTVPKELDGRPLTTGGPTTISYASATQAVLGRSYTTPPG
jgi:predicted AlkP superfamily pyrophosphatase or phosphodiesterase